MKKTLVVMVCCAALAVVCAKEETIDINGDFSDNAKGWKAFKWVKDGTLKVEKSQDGINVASIKTLPGKKGYHFYYTAKLPVSADMKAVLSYEACGKGHLSPGFYLYGPTGKYKGVVYGRGLKLKPDWARNTVEIAIPVRHGGSVIKSMSLYLAATRGGNARVRNVFLTLKTKDEIAWSSQFPGSVPLFTPSPGWHPGKYWKTRRIGKKDFYLAEQGNYIRMHPKMAWPFYVTGLFPAMIPGHWSLKVFEPDAKLVAWQKQEVNDFLTNQWPLFTINYQRMQGWQKPSAAAIRRINNIWIGDGQPEEPIYRLEPVFHFLKTGKKWKGSSMYLWKDKFAVDYLKNELLPRLKKEIPGCTKQNYRWTRKTLKKLCDIYCETYLEVNARPIGYTMYLSPYLIGSWEKTITIAAKAADAGALAVLRGVARQNGGNKFLLSWRGHEPTERYSYRDNSWYSQPSRENWGYPLPHLNYYIFRPYLLGLNYYMNEGFPGSLICDIEGDGTFRLSPTGRIFRALIDYQKRVPKRGVIYTPVALVQGWNRRIGTDGLIRNDDADWMNYALVRDLLLPEHRHTRNSGNYSGTAPYGEIIDLLKPNPEKTMDKNIFDGYKLLIIAGGITISDQYKKVLKQYVRNGGAILINSADAQKYFTSAFTGVEIGNLFTASSISDVKSGKVFNENKFKCFELSLKGAKTLYRAGIKPVVTVNKFGSGRVIITAPRYLLAIKQSATAEGRGKTRTLRPLLLNFCGDFFQRLFDAVTPFIIKTRPADKPDISWVICRKGDNWTVALFNYSLKREELIHESLGTAKVVARYPYKQIPFEIIAKVPASDVVELFEGRDVKHQLKNGRLSVQETIQGGDIRIYEFSRNKLTLPAYQKYVNFALNKPVKVSSKYKAYSPGFTVDGIDNNDYFWQSGEQRRKFTMPQWLMVDLKQPREIDHIKLIFHVWRQRGLQLRKNVYKYKILASLDGKDWSTVIDESKNESSAEPGGAETWFKPVKARYVKLLVLRNASFAGAQVVELAVMGKKTELYQPARKSIIPKWRVKFPALIRDASAQKIRYLKDAKPLQVSPGWMPQGKKWEQLNGWVRLYTDINSLKGVAYTKSLYGESPFEAEYAAPSNAAFFVATCGLGNRDRRASVEFKVYVDGKLKYDSGIFRIGMRLLPVVVELKNAKKIKLITTDGGDGIYYDYAWWGDARFIMR